MIKEFSNQELKKTITNLYYDNKINITEELQKILHKSSKAHYDTLYKHYIDIKNIITERLINQSSDNDEEVKNIQFNETDKTQTEIQDTITIENPICYNIYIENNS